MVLESKECSLYSWKNYDNEDDGMMNMAWKHSNGALSFLFWEVCLIMHRKMKEKPKISN